VNFANFFIKRPVFATVVAVIVVVIGFLAMRSLPIEEYPSVVPPTVAVRATFPGANAQTVAQTVAAPLAESINGVEDMLYITSTSSDSGTMNMNVAFRIGSNGDVNNIDVNNRVQQALPELPESVQAQGVTVEKQSNNILMLVGLTSPSGAYNNIYMQNYATLHILDELRQLQGVGKAEVLGGGEFAMRVWLDPDKLAQYDLTPAEVTAAIQAQNTVVPAGSLAAEPQENPRAYTYTITAGGRLTSPEQFRNIILRTNPDGSALLLQDVARVQLGASFYGINANLNGSTMTPIVINQTPGSNALQTAARVKSTLKRLSKAFPPGLTYVVPYDTTLFINASVDNVMETFFEAFVIVAIIVLLFLQNIRSTLIAMAAVPISVVGAFAGLYALGFSINLLSLFAMILAIGIVVDDAILVVENVSRIIEEDEDISIFAATVEAMKEVGGPVLATAFIMASIFVPVAFLGGFTGQIYQQFALTIAFSVAISAVVALSFTPAMAALFLKRRPKGKESKFKRILRSPFTLFERFFDAVTRLYMVLVRLAVRFWAVSVVLAVLVSAGAFWLYGHTPSGLVPQTDQGIVLASATLPNASSLARTSRYMQALSSKVQQIPGVQYVSTIAGYDLLSQAVNTARGTVFINLVPWGQRNLGVEAVIKRINQIGTHLAGGSVMAFNAPPIPGLSTTGGFSGYLESFQGAGPERLAKAARKVAKAANKQPELSQVFSTFDANVPAYKAKVDKRKALSYGVSIRDLNTTLSNTLGNGFVNFFSYQNRNFRVYMQDEDQFRRTPKDLNNIFVRGGDGQRIPLSEFATLQRIEAPAVTTRFGVYAAAQFQGGPASGYSSGQAIASMQDVVHKTLGDGWGIGWTGTAYQEVNAGNAAVIAIVFGLLMVFLILSAQYESWALPLSVLTAVPFAFLGAILGIVLRGLNTSVYVQVGMLVVVGLAAKNAILIVEFAELQRREQGLSIRAAAIHAARMRFRPIVMTSLAFIFGTLPLALATCAGAANSHQIGTTVVAGMAAVAVLASIFVPAFYFLIAHAQAWLARKRGKQSSKTGSET
jgi:HAE1 family hydrophobic/amphiphilic exporter-1/multidrug efflux pump